MVEELFRYVCVVGGLCEARNDPKPLLKKLYVGYGEAKDIFFLCDHGVPLSFRSPYIRILAKRQSQI